MTALPESTNLQESPSTVIINSKSYIQTVKLEEILETNKKLSIIAINTAIQTMEQIADILTITNKALPKTQDNDPESSETNLDSNDLNTLYRLRIAAVSLLNCSFKRELEKGSNNKAKKLSCPNCRKIGLKWNETEAQYGIRKQRAENCEKWKKVFQPEIQDCLAFTINADDLDNKLDNSHTTTDNNVTQADNSTGVSSSPIRKQMESSKQPESPIFICYNCKNDYSESHNFYPQLCKICGKMNYEKRNQKSDLQGKFALVTGGRIKIGYETVLKLLRCGATVITTTRFPADAAKRYAHEEDFNIWKNRLHIYALDLRFIKHVELFCSHISKKYQRLDILIQNAAQTIRRPTVFYKHLLEQEAKPEESSLFLIHSWEPMSSLNSIESGNSKQIYQFQPENLLPQITNNDNNNNLISLSLTANNYQLQVTKLPKSVTASQLVSHPEDKLYEESLKLTNRHFPSNSFDEDHQQIDLRPNNTWTLETDQIDTTELIEVNLINSISPFILLSKLTHLMQKSIKNSTDKTYSSVILVSSMEGKFNRWKSSQHPHTNCAKASLNMLARTSATYYKGMGILLNAVDTGWVTEEEPYRIRMKRKEAKGTGFQPPLDSVDGAARVLDPVFQHMNNNRNLEHGKFFKDYKPSKW